MRSLAVFLCILYLTVMSLDWSRALGENEDARSNETLTRVDSSPEPSGEDPCPGTEDCCTAHPSKGCDDFNCCDQICNLLPSCCEAVWSQTCADRAVAACDVCEKPYECPQPGDCCSAHATGGCDREGCCDIVCALDSCCCFGKWDGICARKALQFCNNCRCPAFGNLDGEAPIDLHDLAAFMNCFSGAGSHAIPPACACADYDGDRDADLSDFLALVPVLSAP